MTYFVYVYIINIIQNTKKKKKIHCNDHSSLSQNTSLSPDVKCHYGVHIHHTYIYVSL